MLDRLIDGVLDCLFMVLVLALSVIGTLAAGL